MSYEPTNWKKGDKVTSARLNKIEQGIQGIDNDTSTIKEDLSALPSVKDSDAEDVDLDVSDANGNVIVRFEGGHIKTKEFDSSTLTDSGAEVKTSTETDADLDVADLDGNVVLRIGNGHVKTKNFDSADLADKNTYVTVKKDGTGDFSTLRGAIESITDADHISKPYVIQIYRGVYNLTDEYAQSEIESTDFYGWMLTNGISIEGVGSRDAIVLSCNLDTTVYDQTVCARVSTLNASGNCGIKNLTVIAENIRYCMHDDFDWGGSGQYNRYAKNCNFIGKHLSHSPACTWGGGMKRDGENAIYENCDFGTDYGHHFDASQSTHITFKHCRGRKLRFSEREGSSKHYVTIEDSDFEMISLMRPSGITIQHIMIDATGCDNAYVSCNDNDIILTGAIVKTPLTSYPVGTMVTRKTGYGNQYEATSNVAIADGVIVANDEHYSYVQRTGFINTRILGMSNFSRGDFVTIDSNNKLVTGGTAENAVGQITFISNDTDASDQGIGFVKMLFGR